MPRLADPGAPFGDKCLWCARDALNGRTTTVYDAAGRPRRLLDAKTQIATFLYDAAGRQRTQIDALLKRTTNVYSQGRLAAQIDGRNVRTTLLYDAASRLVGRRYPSDAPVTFG